MKILVTGASGLLGYEVARYLQSNGSEEVIAAYNANYPEGLANVRKFDLTKPMSVNEDFDIIVHCAAAIPTSEVSDELAANTNRKIDDNILDYCIKKNKKIIFLSSISLYGTKVNMEIVDENSGILPEMKYTQEKALTEDKIIKAGIPYAIFRVPSPYGFRQKNRTVLKIFIDNAVNGKKIVLFGKGSRTQNFIHVTDVAKAVQKSIFYKDNLVLNIASDRSYSMKETAEIVAQKVFDVNGEKIEIVFSGEDAQENVRSNISIKKAQEIIGWCPEISLENGVLEWIRKI